MTQESLPGSTLLTPLSPMQANLALTTATALTIPKGANYATVTVETANIRYTTDGTTVPTSTVGNLVSSGQTFSLSGATVLNSFSAIQVAAGAVITVSYYRF